MIYLRCIVSVFPKNDAAWTATILFLQFVLQSASFLRIQNNEIPGATLELWELKHE